MATLDANALQIGADYVLTVAFLSLKDGLPLSIKSGRWSRHRPETSPQWNTLMHYTQVSNGAAPTVVPAAGRGQVSFLDRGDAFVTARELVSREVAVDCFSQVSTPHNAFVALPTPVNRCVDFGYTCGQEMKKATCRGMQVAQGGSAGWNEGEETDGHWSRRTGSGIVEGLAVTPSQPFRTQRGWGNPR